MTQISGSDTPQPSTSQPPLEFGPDIKVPDIKPGESASFWAELSSTDDSGISVDGIQADDEVYIEVASGACAFDNNRLEVVLSIVSLAAGIFKPAWLGQVNDMRKALGDKGGGKKRDAYGQEVGGDGNYAEKEGGIIVCMPAYGGTVYANDQTHAKRLPNNTGRVSNSPNNYLFPGRDPSSRKVKVKSGGVLRIAVFDGNHGDNAGSYEVKFTITR